MATEVITATAKELELKSCPFCGSRPEVVKGQVSRVGCCNRNCGLFGVLVLVRFWNVRIDHAPTTRQRAERAVAKIVALLIDHEAGHPLGGYPRQSMAGIIAAEFEK